MNFTNICWILRIIRYFFEKKFRTFFFCFQVGLRSMFWIISESQNFDLAEPICHCGCEFWLCKTSALFQSHTIIATENLSNDQFVCMSHKPQLIFGAAISACHRRQMRTELLNDNRWSLNGRLLISKRTRGPFLLFLYVYLCKTLLLP